MIERPRVNRAEIDAYYQRLHEEAQSGGYNLNPDELFTRDLIEGLIVNEKRYGYPSCPCRASTGVKNEDLDIICPCDYRDQDLDQHHTCFCGLYVSRWAIDNHHKISSIPERRPLQKGRDPKKYPGQTMVGQSMPVWRCRVCGYLCARDKPPEICPICKAKKERFERFSG